MGGEMKQISKLQSRDGFGLIELLVGISTVIIVTFIIMDQLASVVLFRTRGERQLDVQRSVTSLAETILLVGRYGTVCNHPCGINCEIQCTIDPDGSGSSSMDVAFKSFPSDHEVRYLVKESGAWTERVRFPGIESLLICGDVELSPNPPTCAIEPTIPAPIDEAYQALLAAALIPPNRFFRFRVLGVRTIQGVETYGRRPSIQASFTLRNPTLFTSSSSASGKIVYVKGH